MLALGALLPASGDGEQAREPVIGTRRGPSVMVPCSTPLSSPGPPCSVCPRRAHRAAPDPSCSELCAPWDVSVV